MRTPQEEIKLRQDLERALCAAHNIAAEIGGPIDEMKYSLKEMAAQMKGDACRLEEEAKAAIAENARLEAAAAAAHGRLVDEVGKHFKFIGMAIDRWNTLEEVKKRGWRAAIKPLLHPMVIAEPTVPYAYPADVFKAAKAASQMIEDGLSHRFFIQNIPIECHPGYKLDDVLALWRMESRHRAWNKEHRPT